MNFQGFHFFVRDWICISHEWKQYRFPKSKKKRIRNKWRKRNNNFRNEEVHKAPIMGNDCFVSQKIYDELVKNTK